MGKRKKRSVIRAYKALLADDHDWDYEFLLRLERKKLQRMAKYFSVSDITDANIATAKELSLCVRLLDIVLHKERFRDKWTSEAHKHLETHHEKIGDGKGYRLEFEHKGMVPDFPKYVNLSNAARFVPTANFPKAQFDSEEERKYWGEHFKDNVREAKAWHLYNIIREYKMFGWWD